MPKALRLDDMLDLLVDIHSHILFGLDDGAKSIEESVELLKALEQTGFVHAVLTPHCIRGVYDFETKDAGEKLEKLRDACSKEGLKIELSLAAEYFLDSSLLDLLDSNQALFVNQKNKTLLVQAPMLKIPNYLKQLAFELKLRRVVPIIVHPERYTDVAKKPQRVKEFLDAGFLVQVNLGSLGRLYGEKIRLSTEKLLRFGLVHFVATDLHAPHHVETVLTRGLARLLQLKKEDGAKKLMSENPMRVIKGEEIADLIWID